jgi:hypothetical protein
MSLPQNKGSGAIARHDASIAADVKSVTPPLSAPVPSGPPSVRLAAEWEACWKELMAKPCTRERDDQVIAAIEDLASRDALRAIALAQNESRSRMSQNMLRAALRGWALVNPEAAADWALTQTKLDKVDALASALQGTMKDPNAATLLYSRLLQKAPDLSAPLGTSLVTLLANRGEFTRAADFAATGAPENRLDWLNTAYSIWADYQPESALAAANSLSNAAMKDQALAAVFSMWSVNSPEAVVEYAATLPAGHHRELAFTDALRNWAVNDPATAAEWINNAEPSPELDAGIACIATSSQVRQTPRVAVTWAESISEPTLRSSTLAEIVHHWAATDLVAARTYVNSSKAMETAELAALRAELNGL